MRRHLSTLGWIRVIVMFAAVPFELASQWHMVAILFLTALALSIWIERRAGLRAS